MPSRVPLPGTGKLCFLLFLATFLATVMLPAPAHAQGLELGGGYAYSSGNFGTNGFDADAAWWFTRRITIAVNYDDMYNATTLGVFTFSKTGAISVHSQLQNYFVLGPRIFFSTHWTDKYRLNPFGEVQFGVSHLSQRVQQVNLPSQSASGTDFTWLIGGGAEYLVSPRWSLRANLDFLRTHFASSGQSHVRLVLGVYYTFGDRFTPKK
jgi:opacity protein-like surface antigen